MKEWFKFLILLVLFIFFYFLNPDNEILIKAIKNGFFLLNDYAKNHVLTCLVPAFFIAGGISVLLSKDFVLRLLGAQINKWVSYSVASISGGILAVCSCTILPMFGGIWKRGAGLGPAITFLFSGPAINITAIFLTGSVLGWDFSIYRIVASIAIAIISGRLIAIIFEENETNSGEMDSEGGNTKYSPIVMSLFFVLQLLILIIFSIKSIPFNIQIAIGAISILIILMIIIFKFRKSDSKHWIEETWDFTKKIMPYLFIGIFTAGIITEIIPDDWIITLVGSNSVLSNFIASLFGAASYFATLTEVPILESLMKMGMHKGPALSLLLTGNSLSLPSMLVLFKLLGAKKTVVYYLLVISQSVFAGYLFGIIS